MALGLTQPLTEKSTRNLPVGGGGEGVRRGRCIRLTTSPPLSRKYGILDVPQSDGLPRPVTGIALLLTFYLRNMNEISDYKIISEGTLYSSPSAIR
jgi:hypothetical protein